MDTVREHSTQRLAEAVRYRACKALAAVILGLGLLTVSTTLIGVVRHYSPVPFWDQWDGGIEFYLQALEDPLTAFFAQHNEHRLVFSNLIFFADIRYFGGRNVFDLAANGVLAALEAIVLYRLVVRHLPREFATRVTAAGVALTFVFSFIQRENFDWGFQNQWFAVYLFALCAFHSLERSVAVGQRNAGWWYAGAVVCATLSTISMASGLLTFPMLIIMALHLRLPIRKVGILAMVTVLVWVAYFHHWSSPGGASLTGAIKHDPLGVLKYIVLYLGAPLNYTVPHGRALVYFAGAATIAATAIGVRRALAGSERPRALALLATAIFLIGNAAITAAGRYAFGLSSAMSSRYTTASLLAAFCAISFLWLNTSRAIARRAVAASILLSTLLVFTGQLAVRDSAQSEVFGKRIGGLALRWGVYDPVYTAGLFPESALRSIVPPAQRAGLSIFAPDSIDYPPVPHAISASARCEGTIEEILPTQTHGVFAARGWAIDPSTRKYIRSVVLAAPDGETVGEGFTGEHREDLVRATGLRDQFGGWVGFLTGAPGQYVMAFGALGNGRYCSLKSAKEIPSEGETPPPRS